MPTPAARRARAGVPHPRRAPGAPLHGRDRLRGLHRRAAALVPDPRLLPQLGPDELVWKNNKHDRVARAGVSGPDQFKALALKALRRLQAISRIVRGFFADPNLAYITDTT